MTTFTPFNKSTLTNVVAIILLMMAGAWIYQEILLPMRAGEEVNFQSVMVALFALATSAGNYFARDANKNDVDSQVDH